MFLLVNCFNPCVLLPCAFYLSERLPSGLVTPKMKRLKSIENAEQLENFSSAEKLHACNYRYAVSFLLWLSSSCVLRLPEPETGIKQLLTSVSFCSDGQGELTVPPLLENGEDDGGKRSARVKVLTPDLRSQIENMTHPSQLPREERKRQYAALDRRMKETHTLRPGLLEKYQASHGSSQAKFELLRAFMLDRDLSTITIESYYIDQSKQTDKDGWEELPLAQLRRIYTSPEEKALWEDIWPRNNSFSDSSNQQTHFTCAAQLRTNWKAPSAGHVQHTA